MAVPLRSGHGISWGLRPDRTVPERHRDRRAARRVRPHAAAGAVDDALRPLRGGQPGRRAPEPHDRQLGDAGGLRAEAARHRHREAGGHPRARRRGRGVQPGTIDREDRAIVRKFTKPVEVEPTRRPATPPTASPSTTAVTGRPDPRPGAGVVRLRGAPGRRPAASTRSSSVRSSTLRLPEGRGHAGAPHGGHPHELRRLTRADRRCRRRPGSRAWCWPEVGRAAWAATRRWSSWTAGRWR